MIFAILQFQDALQFTFQHLSGHGRVTTVMHTYGTPTSSTSLPSLPSSSAAAAAVAA